MVAHDLSLRYRSGNPETRGVVVNGANFEIGVGEVLAVVGETGAGKSTLAKAVALQAELSPEISPIISGGSLSVLGQNVRGISTKQRDELSISVGYLPQEAGDFLEPRFTIGENIAEPIFSRDDEFDQHEAGEYVAMLLDAVRLPMGTMNRYPHELSKGQRQRVAIARSMILEPTVFVADDPTAGIDVTVRGAILDIISSLQKERAFSALIITADLAEVRRISTRVAVMHRGIIVGIGNVDEVLADPRHPYVSGLVRSLDHLREPERANA
ncbi:MAG: ABC transporter ATP-binding protein [Salinibacterium sp.]|nr:MAG: ABC transporter ATP-binding protein [Salinibacterium sp.]